MDTEDKQKLRDIERAITGDDMGNPGLIPRINSFFTAVKKREEERDKRIGDLEQRVAKLEWRQKIMWTIITSITTAGGAATGVGIWQAVINAPSG